MKKYKFTFLLTVLMSMVGATISAHDFAVANADGVTIYYVKTSDTEVKVSYRGSVYDSYSNEYTGNVVIPESVNYDGKTYSVTSIGREAFTNCSVTSVTIPNSVTSIGYMAFYACFNLASISIPNSVASIGGAAFYRTAWYNKQPNGLVYAGKVAYEYKGTMPDNTSITIKEGTLGIAGGAFSGCSGLTSIEIPNSVTSIGDGAFSGCSGLTSIEIPNSMTRIGDQAFKNCSGLASVTFHCKEIGPGFSGLTSIKEVIIGEEVKSIGNSAFEGCSGLTSVVIPNSVTSIGERAFFNTKLNSVTIGSGVLSIGSYVFGFYNCAPAKVIWLANTPPTGCSNAGGIVNYVSNNSYSSASYVSLGNIKVYPFLSSMFEVDGVKYVPVSPSERTCDAIDCAYNESAENINVGKSVSYQGINMTVKNVNPYICYGNPFVKNVDFTFEGNLESCTFLNCTAMTSVTLGENITSIGDFAFSGCSSLQSITIPNAVTSIGDYSFDDCTSMTSVKMGTGVKTIGTYAFSGCSALPQIVIPKFVTKIDDYAFFGCTSLANIHMEDPKGQYAALTLGSNGRAPLFSSCPLDEVYIGRNILYSTVNNKGYSPFYRNTSLKTVTITNKETEISPNEFYGCTSLKNVTIGDGVTTIGDWAFSGCSSLDYFACGSKVANIGKEAFSDCTAMTKLVSRAATPPVCGAQALDDINKWNCKLQVPEASIPTYQAADQWKEFFFIEPTYDIIPGDVNSDNLVNVTDIVATVNYIMEKPSEGFNKAAADLNGDGEINVTDIVKMVSIIMSGDAARRDVDE